MATSSRPLTDLEPVLRRTASTPGTVEGRLAFLLRASAALLFLWFGVLKFVPGLSPAESLASRTTEVLTFGLVRGHLACVLVAALEVAIAVLLLSGRLPQLTGLVFLGHMAGTAMPLVLFPAETWAAPMVGTLEGQYILKNVVLIATVVSGLVLTIRDRAQTTTAQAPAVQSEKVKEAALVNAKNRPGGLI
ncbi:DoxX family protein [Kitasatospora sp. NPDC051853]|uniref:DoxX family protein n=1 Tax=Kitasatospora sp. NPDC051853 TaxID=3364058 RepID=UPI00379FDD8A